MIEKWDVCCCIEGDKSLECFCAQIEEFI